MQRQQDEQEGFPKSTLVWLRAGIRAVCVSKKMLRKAFFMAAPMHLTVCARPPLCLRCIPTLSHYPFTLISVIFTGQNDTQLPKNPVLSYHDMVLTCAVTLHHYLCELEVPLALQSAMGEGLKGVRHRNEREREREATALRLLSIEPVPL